MKNRKNFLTALAFVLAIGSALASEFFVAQQGYTKRSEVPDSQSEDCKPREFCNGNANPCTMIIGSSVVNLYDGSTQSQSTCGQILREN
ncbi:MAG: hypothetical protein C0490_28365 [Marivirga sp.]|nr:hypothetical protein [Marivirga sp.]